MTASITAPIGAAVVLPKAPTSGATIGADAELDAAEHSGRRTPPPRRAGSVRGAGVLGSARPAVETSDHRDQRGRTDHRHGEPDDEQGGRGRHGGTIAPLSTCRTVNRRGAPG